MVFDIRKFLRTLHQIYKTVAQNSLSGRILMFSFYGRTHNHKYFRDFIAILLY